MKWAVSFNLALLTSFVRLILLILLDFAEEKNDCQ